MITHIADASKYRRIAVFAIACAASLPARALTYVDEVTFFIANAAFHPGGIASAKGAFATSPGIELSSFSFTLTWDSTQVSPVATGAGSIREWATSLDGLGTFTSQATGAQSISGTWLASYSSSPENLIEVSYARPMALTFNFQTTPAFNSQFLVSFELFDLVLLSGETLDTGSGFVSSATMTPAPIPEPASWSLLLCGIAGLAIASTRRSTTTERPACIFFACADRSTNAQSLACGCAATLNAACPLPTMTRT